MYVCMYTLLYGPFLWMGFNCLKARATSRRQFTCMNIYIYIYEYIYE